MKIGFYGLGIMGSRMAEQLLSLNDELMVYNRTFSKANLLAKKGATVADSPQELSAHADILFTMLSTPEVVKEVAIGEQGFLSAMKPQSLWIDCSTVNPSFSREMADVAQKHNIRFVDAPVAGSKAPAETGELLFLVGGDKEDVQQGIPYFNAMGKKVIHAGDVGMGTSLKMVFNLLLGEAMSAFSEAIHLGKSLGLSQEILLENLIGSPVVAPFIAAKKNKIVNNEYDPEFPLKWMHKDLELASKSGYESNTPLPAVNIIKELYAMAKKKDMGEQDFSAIFNLFSDG